MLVRSFSWGKHDLSWAVVIEELLKEFSKQGDSVLFRSPNGYEGASFLTEEFALKSQKAYAKAIADFDFCYLKPMSANIATRFDPRSKFSGIIYSFETNVLPKEYVENLNKINLVMAPSKYISNIFINNGVHADKCVVIPHGVNAPDKTKKIKVTDKKFSFGCVAEPHVRKNLDLLLDLYCKTFTAKDDVSFILKTGKTVPGQSFNVDIMAVYAKLKKKYGKKIPEIKIIDKRISKLDYFYNSINAFVLLSSSEGFCIPMLEALNYDLPVVAPNFGGQLDFLNNENSLLVPVTMRQAKEGEIYAQLDKKQFEKSYVSHPDLKVASQYMQDLYKGNHKINLEAIASTVKEFTWENAVLKIKKEINDRSTKG